jgi:acetolactate synthase-1/2/3 large subunit
MKEKLTGAQALIRSLERENVEVMFGLPGGCILPAYDPLLESSIRHILVRHEQGAGHMAEGYAHVTGRPGVAMVTSGPAATNLVTPLCDAYMDSIPMVGITGQVPTAAIGTDAFQECDTVGITRSITKHNELVMSAQDIPMVVRQAFHIATTGRPGPTLIDLPKDVLQNSMEWYWLPPEREGSRQDDQRSCTHDPRRQAAGAVRRWWSAQGSCSRCAA